MYKLGLDRFGELSNAVLNLEAGLWIPFDPANTDYQQFKTDVLGGAELQDAEGGTMTQEQTNDFIATLP